MEVINTSGLTKQFGRKTAVEDISLNVQEGEIYGFLGLNGAGKTTTIRMLLGMISPDKGEVSIFGKKVGKGRGPWEKVGYLVETPDSYPNLTVKENLHLIFKLRKLSSKKSIDEIIDQLQLGKFRDTKAAHLSLGNKQRLGLAKALIHKPALLVLDEPTNGLDPAGIVEIRNLLQDLSLNHQTTIFISSHLLTEVSRLVTRIGIVNQGRLITEVSSGELKNQLTRKLLVQTGQNLLSMEILQKNHFQFQTNMEGQMESYDPRAIDRPEEISRILVKENIDLKMLSVWEEDLEAYFLRKISQKQTR